MSNRRKPLRRPDPEAWAADVAVSEVSDDAVLVAAVLAAMAAPDSTATVDDDEEAGQ